MLFWSVTMQSTTHRLHVGTGLRLADIFAAWISTEGILGAFFLISKMKNTLLVHSQIWGRSKWLICHLINLSLKWDLQKLRAIRGEKGHKNTNKVNGRVHVQSIWWKPKLQSFKFNCSYRTEYKGVTLKREKEINVVLVKLYALVKITFLCYT